MMKQFFMMKKYILALLVGLSPVLFYAQEEAATKVTPDAAASKMKVGNYEDALVDYLQLLNTEPRNELYNYNAGICYLNTNSNKAKAVPYLEIVTRKDKYNHEADYLLARAYHYAGRYDDAIKMYENYKIYLSKQSKSNDVDVNNQIQYCQNAKELVKFPVNVTFQSLGNNVNSEYDDYFPFVTANESVIYFNTKRPEKNAEKLENGQFANSIYYSKVNNGQYSKASNAVAVINTGSSKMEIIGLSANGDVMLLSNSTSSGKLNVFISTLTEKGTYTKSELFRWRCNSSCYIE
jgi:tetratricopeptide (TPR) repeat protein